SFIMLPENSATMNTFANRWHKDTTYLELNGHKFHWERDFLMVGAAYYLQDNSPEYGGGLDVEPGSHYQPDYFDRPRKRGLLESAWNQVARKVKPAGSLTRITRPGGSEMIWFAIGSPSRTRLVTSSSFTPGSTTAQRSPGSRFPKSGRR